MMDSGPCGGGISAETIHPRIQWGGAREGGQAAARRVREWGNSEACCMALDSQIPLHPVLFREIGWDYYSWQTLPLSSRKGAS